MKRWLAFDIGCIECGEESAVVGVFSSPEDAKVAAGAASVKQAADWHGEHHFEVYEIDVPS